VRLETSAAMPVAGGTLAARVFDVSSCVLANLDSVCCESFIVLLCKSYDMYEVNVRSNVMCRDCDFETCEFCDFVLI
jgi:hypothetical protein